jgi:hypothetical protein
MSELSRQSYRNNNQEDTMETKTETVTVRGSRAGDPNSEIFIQLPVEAMELAYEHAARELVAALGEIDRRVGDKRARDLDVDELFVVQSELDRARTAVDTLFKARPDEEWEEPDDDE